MVPIVALLKNPNPELQGLALVCIMNLSATGENCPAITAAGAMQPLALLCASANVKVARLAQDCIATLNNKTQVRRHPLAGEVALAEPFERAK